MGLFKRDPPERPEGRPSIADQLALARQMQAQAMQMQAQAPRFVNNLFRRGERCPASR